jgi:hypothetical protein
LAEDAFKGLWIKCGEPGELQGSRPSTCREDCKDTISAG